MDNKRGSRKQKDDLWSLKCWKNFVFEKQQVPKPQILVPDVFVKYVLDEYH